MIRKASLAFGTAVIILLLLRAAPAATLYEIGLDGTMEGRFSNVGGQVIGESFLLATPATVTGINWYGYYRTDLPPGTPDVDFEISFFADGGGIPSPPPILTLAVAASPVDTGFLATGDPINPSATIYAFSASVSALAVSAGVETWVSIAEDDPGTPRVGGTQWMWCRGLSGVPAGSAFYSTSGDTWSPTGDNHAFSIQGSPSGVVPLPAPLWAGGGLLLLLAAVRVRTRTRIR